MHGKFWLFLALAHVASGCSGSAAAGAVAPASCGTEFTPIHSVQGAGTSSPIVGQTVTVEGVVVGDFQGDSALGGFFLQADSSQFDTDAETSEGLFVYDPHSLVDVAIGDWAAVSGTVREYEGLTELSDLTRLSVCAHGIPAATREISLPIESDLEALEGMRVTVAQPLYVADTSQLGHYGEVRLSSSRRLMQPTEVVAPGMAAQGLLAENEHSTILVDDGSLRTYPSVLPFTNPQGTLRVGDSITELTGVLGYAFAENVIYPVSSDFPTFSTENPRPQPPPKPNSSLRVVSFNVGNYFTTLNTGAPECGPNGDLDCRGANSNSEFTRQRAKILCAITQLGPDILALVELENNTDASLRDVVSGLNDSLGVDTYSFIDTGALGTDAIKVGLVYNTFVVAPLGPHAVLDASVDPEFPDTLNRPVLAQSFTRRSNGETLTVVVNHLKSKGSSCTGDADIGDGQGPCNGARLAAVRAEVRWLASDPTHTGKANIVIAGDFNAYAKEDPVIFIVNSGYSDIGADFQGEYSYVFSGQSGSIDHIFVSPSLARNVAHATAWHINADEPSIFDYNEEHNPKLLYQPDAFRSSDHDPFVLDLLEPPI